MFFKAITPSFRKPSLHFIHLNHPQEQWAYAFTDGSATNATKNKGGGLYIEYKDGESIFSISTRKGFTNHKAKQRF